MSPAVGDLAPDLTLTNQDGEKVTLSDLRGRKVVLVFFPWAFSRICTGELCDLRDRRGEFDDDTVMLGISIDSKQALKAFAERDGYQFDLLSDAWPHGQVARAYGVFNEDRGAARRGTFIIDREGVIRWKVVKEIGEERDLDDYRAALADIDLVDARA